MHDDPMPHYNDSTRDTSKNEGVDLPHNADGSPEERGRLGMQELLQQLDASVHRPPTPLFFSDDEDEPSPSRADEPSPSRADEPSPSRASRSRTRSPPRKRVRRHGAARVYLDTEAQVAEQDEDSDGSDDMGDFIDDEPRHIYPATQQRRYVLGTDEEARLREAETQRLQDIAAKYDELARAERAPLRLPFGFADNSPPVGVSRYEIGAAEPIAPRIPSGPLWAGIFTIITPENMELNLILYLMGTKSTSCIISAGTHGPGSRFVFVETTDVWQLQRAVEDWSRQRWPNSRMKRKDMVPVQVPDLECFSLIIPPGDPNCFHPFALPFDRFARIQSKTLGGLYYNDLAFVEPQNIELWVVPRIQYEPGLGPQNLRPNRQLFERDHFKLKLPDEKLDIIGNRFAARWGSRLFDIRSGLEHLPHKLKHSTLDVVPTDDELALFTATCAPELLQVFQGRTCALQEGDLVLVLRGSLSGKVGHIAGLFDKKLAGKRVRIAVVLPALADAGRDAGRGELAPVDKASPPNPTGKKPKIVIPDGAFMVPVFCIRLHFLAVRRPAPTVGDRIVVVAGDAYVDGVSISGAYCGVSGRITECPTPDIVRFQASKPEPHDVEVEVRHVRLDFQCGDTVHIICGEHEGHIGFIVGVHSAGIVDFYACNQMQKLTAVHESYEPLLSRKPELALAAAFTYDDRSSQEAPTYKIPTTHLAFVPIDNAGFIYSALGDWRGQSMIQSAREAASFVDRIRNEMERDLMRTGQWVIGKFVRIIGKHSQKGYFGPSSMCCSAERIAP